MKRFIVLLSLLCGISYADTINIDWVSDDSIHAQTTCEMGGDLILPTPPSKPGYTFVGWTLHGLTPLEYIENTGTQWIDPNIEINQNIKYVFDVSLYSTARQQTLGAGGSNDERLASIRIGGPYSNFTFFRNNISYTPCNVPIDTNRHTLIMDIYNNKVQIDNCEQILPTQYPQTGNSYKMYIGAYSREGGVDLSIGWVGKYYNVKFYDQDVLIRDFIPVLDADDVPCMYDLVEGKFYYNSGTGNFIAGPMI